MVDSVAIVQFVCVSLTTDLRVLLNSISSSCLLNHVNGTICDQVITILAHVKFDINFERD